MSGSSTPGGSTAQKTPDASLDSGHAVEQCPVESRERGGASSDRDDDHHEVLDTSAFPRFAPLLIASQSYAELSGCRFRAGSFSGLPLEEQSSGAQASIPKSGCRFSGERLQVKMHAAPAVQEFSDRLLAGEAALVEELERASRIVMAETVRNAVVATCRKFELWPPSPPTPGVESTDCSYEDMSAKLDVIAQRAYHDHMRRDSTEEWGGSESGLARRALTASFLVDFASENGAPLPPLPETFRAMLAELEQRAAEWEAEVRSSFAEDTSLSPTKQALLQTALPRMSNFSLSAAADNLRTLSGLRAATVNVDPDDHQAGAGSTTAAEEEHELVIDTISTSDLEINQGLPAGKITCAYVELELGKQYYKTLAPAPGTHEAGNDSFKFEGEVAKFEYKEQAELAVRVRVPGGLQAFLLGDPLVGEIVLPLGAELYNHLPRKVQVPISYGTDHAGVVSLRMTLRLKREASPFVEPDGRPREDTLRRARGSADANASRAAVGHAVGAVVGAVASSVESARDVIGKRASLRTRAGFGTCERQEASVIIVTEEGTGYCYYYPYATQDEAASYFNSRRWWLTSRIMFRCESGRIGEELCHGGPFPAYRTIRRAAQLLLKAPDESQANESFALPPDDLEVMPG